MSATQASRAITIRLTGTGAPSEGPYPSIARVPSTTTNWLGSVRRGYNGVGTTLAVKVEEAAPTIESRLPAREQMTRGQFDLVVVDHIGMMLPEGKAQSETQRMNEISGDLLKLSKSALLGNPTLLFVSPFTKGEPSDLPGMHRFRDTFMLAHNAHLLLGVYEDAAGGKLLHIAGMRSSNGQGDISRNIPISIRKEDGVIVEETPRPHLL